MKKIMRFITDLTLTLWLGGIFFFTAIMAPTVFDVMSVMVGGSEFAGILIARAIYPLNALGILCGGVFLIASYLQHRKLLRADHLLMLVMLLLAFTNRNYITPKMETIFYSAQHLDKLTENDARKLEFDKLHKISTGTECAIFILGLAIVGIRTAKDE
jgi:hypothetical protein